MAGDLDERELRAWQAFMQMQESVRGRIERGLQETGDMSIADYSVLSMLSGAADERLRAFELGGRLGWEKSRLHHQLTRMERRGLVERQAESRATYVRLTDQGRAVLADAVPRYSRDIRELVLDHLTSAQVDQLAEISERILAAHENEAS